MRRLPFERLFCLDRPVHYHNVYSKLRQSRALRGSSLGISPILCAIASLGVIRQ